MTTLYQIGGRLVRIGSALGSGAGSSGGGGGAGPDNTMALTNVSGSTVTNYPLSFARIFADGEIADTPAPLIDGSPVTAGVDVKTRWPSGKAQHAIFGIVVSSMTNNVAKEITFENNASPDNTALTKSEMLAFDFDSVISLTVGGVTHTASARDMLNADKYTVWRSNQVVTEIILCDHSSSHSYDMTWSSVPVRPIFHAKFWSALNKVEVAAIIEQSDPEHLGDISISTLTITKGSASPTTAYSKSSVTLYLGSRFISRFWIGTAPTASVNLDHNLTYLKDTQGFPNYDTDIVPTPTVLSNFYSAWGAKSTDFNDRGWWAQDMGDPGGRYEVGPIPTWAVLWLYTGDYRTREVALKQSDLASAWPMCFRETVTTKRLLRTDTVNSGTGLGLPISAADRKTTKLASADYGYGSTLIGDQLKVIGTNGGVAAAGWKPDAAHQPDAFATQYALTGDYFYLEQMHFWASWSVHVQNGAAYEFPYGRGPTGAEAGFYFGEARAAGWMCRNRSLACFWTPDDHPMKECLTVMMDDGLAHWEGRMGITGGSYDGHAVYDWAYAFNTPSHTNALHLMEKDTSIQNGGQSPWMIHYCMVGLGRAVELGFDASAILSWLSLYDTGMVTDPASNPFMLEDYQHKTGPTGNTVYYQTWSDMVANAPGLPNADVTRTSFDIPDSTSIDHTRCLIATCAASFVTTYTNGATLWTFCDDNVYTLIAGSAKQTNPKWCILPRT